MSIIRGIFGGINVRVAYLHDLSQRQLRAVPVTAVAGGARLFTNISSISRSGRQVAVEGVFSADLKKTQNSRGGIVAV